MSTHRCNVGVADITTTPLDDDAVETFRSAVMRLGFLALDRPDVYCAAKVRCSVLDSGQLLGDAATDIWTLGTVRATLVVEPSFWPGGR